MLRILAATLLFALGGCASMDSAECRAADWRAIGYEDGVQGQSPDYFGKRRKACAGHGITADFEAYLAGRDEGVAYFCRPRNGYSLGARGYTYSGACPVALEGAFLAAHAEGYGLYERQAALAAIRKRLHHSKERAKDIEYILVEKTVLLVSSEVEVTDRAAIAVELKQLAVEMADVEISIRQLEHDYAVAERDYEDYRNHLSYRRGR